MQQHRLSIVFCVFTRFCLKLLLQILGSCIVTEVTRFTGMQYDVYFLCVSQFSLKYVLILTASNALMLMRTLFILKCTCLGNLFLYEIGMGCLLLCVRAVMECLRVLMRPTSLPTLLSCSPPIYTALRSGCR